MRKSLLAASLLSFAIFASASADPQTAVDTNRATGTSPETDSRKAPVDELPAVGNRLTEIMELRRQRGSVLSGTLLDDSASGVAADEPRAFEDALLDVAKRRPIDPLQLDTALAATRHESTSAKLESSVFALLRQTARDLEREANRIERQSHSVSADRLRAMADRLRAEARQLARDARR